MVFVEKVQLINRQSLTGAKNSPGATSIAGVQH
jgi:hypothetical protein